MEIGWTLSVAVAIVIGPASPVVPPGGITLASSARPMPAAWIPGETNSIERNHSRSRTIDATKATTSSSSGAAPARTATTNRSGSVDAKWR